MLNLLNSKVMNVQEAIDALMAIEDKTLPVKFVQQYNIINGEDLEEVYLDQFGKFVVLGA